MSDIKGSSVQPVPMTALEHTTAPESEELRTEWMDLSMGPQHPSTHGVLRIRLKCDGEWVKEADPDLGYLHRSFEKMGEIRTYPQNIFLTDRWDYLAAMSNNLVICLAVEKLLGVEVPDRAQYLRVLAAELQRVASHLVFAGTFGLDVGAMTPFLYCFREREKILDWFEEICGARLTYNYIRIGGVGWDLPEPKHRKNSKSIEEEMDQFLPTFSQRLDELDDLLTNNKIFRARTMGVGAMTEEQAYSYGCSGPYLRASGISYDVRTAQPYCNYEQLDFNVIVSPRAIGDCFDRYWVRTQEMRESLKLIEQVIRKLNELPRGDAEIQAKVPPKPKPAAGDAYFAIESPRGELGVYLISDGGDKPYRMRIRSPGFTNLSTIPELGVDWKIADFVAILGSVDIVMGEVDR